MKKIIFLFVSALFIACAFAQSTPSPNKWHVTLKIVDEAGQPVENAAVQVWYYVKPPPDETEASEKIEGLTDANGIFTASHADTKSISLNFHVTKLGYYSTTSGQDLGSQYDPIKWNPNQTLILKKVGTPTAMYVKSLNLGLPAFEKAVGFDLMVGDWVAPYGKGINADIFFTGHFDKHTEGESDYTLTVSFPNSGDGIQEFSAPASVQETKEGVSDLRSPQEAPVDGYQSKWIQTDNRKQGQPAETNRDLHHNYFLRVRTVLDANGNVKSALYGKIYGDFMQFRYYLNPTPNSRNIEFDPKQNLLHGMKSFERVSAP